MDAGSNNQNCKEAIISEDYADLIIDNISDLEQLRSIEGVCSYPLPFNAYNVNVPMSKLPKDFVQIYGYGSVPNVYGLLDIESLSASGIERTQNIPSLNFRGKGTLIGIIDTGIDYRHEAFIKPDNTSKIYAIWDQTINDTDNQPEGILYGTEYLNDQINEALASLDPLSVVPSTDTNGHGTFLAGIAAGNLNVNEKFSGVVPEAEIVVVKLKQTKNILLDFWGIPRDVVAFQKNDLIMGIRYLHNVARRAKKPMSMIVGIGTSQGGHDEMGSLSRYISNLAGSEGIAISIAGGNEGSTRHHYKGSVDTIEVPDKVELNVAENVSGFSMEIWGKTPSNFTIDIQAPSGEYVPPLSQLKMQNREIRFIFDKTIITVDFQLTEAVSGEQMILLRFTNPTAGIWRFGVYLQGTIPLRYHIWLPIENFLSRDTFFLLPDPEYTLTSPGNTIVPIVTTAYNYRDASLYINASRGFTRNEGIAPSLAAPGVNIIGPAIPRGYRVNSGSSVSCAHTAGVAAMLLEWGVVRGNYPRMSTVEIRNLLIRGASRKPNLIYPNKEWGYGILDIYNTYDNYRGSLY